MSLTVHRQKKEIPISAAVITVSDTRTEETDKSGKKMIDYLEEEGYKVSYYKICKDDQYSILTAIKEIDSYEIDVILFNGGTGLAKRDVTIETITPLFTKEITGFGELFRYLSFTEDIGSAAILSRATAGIYKDRVIFSTPGSTGAVKLAMEKLILPELQHIVNEIRK
ncbi:molybdenum cofactor biosynthesis protein B [Bacillus pakistanensis]|uniref:Molybdenum cofactor biosynthesis protein B n=1 Tax=Rossellomorea pakistanensis TaxID=992288 RepID=A0ABS2NAR9_9BACI|nr:molybdenum cofactor biosynthesis protein B [Bacillus pakistanensis]